MEGDQLGRNHPLGSTAFEGRGLDDPVAESDRPESRRGEGIDGAHARTVLSTRHNGAVDLEDFYNADPRRRHSEELEFGTDWSEDGARTQVSWVETTGEIYAMRDPLGGLWSDPIGDVRPTPVSDEQLTVEVLGVVNGRERATAVMSGWEAAMSSGDNSLSWVRDRIANADGEMSDTPAQPSRDLPAD
jgi:hypothetical protein